MADDRFLIGDIGGTNIRLASFRSDPRQREQEVTYRLDPKTGKPFAVIEAIRQYVRQSPGPFVAACLGVAGRVKIDSVQITNRPDFIETKAVADLLEIPIQQVRLVNDMPSHLASIDRLLPAERIELKAGALDGNGTRVVLMPGTGVGVGGAVAIPGQPHRPFASEAGHLDFAPRDEQQDRLLRYMRARAADLNLSHVSTEFVLCGEGIRRIYGFFQQETGQANSDAEVPKAEQITAAAAVGKLPPGDLNQLTVDLFLSLLGAAAGNLAMAFAATGGVYVGGSICLTLRQLLGGDSFLRSFSLSGPPAHHQLLQEIPVRLIDYRDSGLLGAGVMALWLM